MSNYQLSTNLFDEFQLISYATLGAFKRIAVGAIELFNSVFVVDEELRYDFYRDRGIHYAKQGRYGQAISFLKPVAHVRPNDEALIFYLGYSFLKMDRVMEGIELLSQGMAKIASARICTTLGMAYIEAKEYQKASTALTEGLRQAPDNFNLHYRLGLARDHLGEYDAAIASFQEALRIRPNETKVYQALGLVLDQQGKHDEAVIFFKKNVELTSS